MFLFFLFFTSPVATFFHYFSQNVRVTPNLRKKGGERRRASKKQFYYSTSIADGFLFPNRTTPSEIPNEVVCYSKLFFCLSFWALLPNEWKRDLKGIRNRQFQFTSNQVDHGSEALKGVISSGFPLRRLDHGVYSFADRIG